MLPFYNFIKMAMCPCFIWCSFPILVNIEITYPSNGRKESMDKNFLGNFIILKSIREAMGI